jgi:hypothetical protein
MAALDSAHAALALGCPTVVVVRMSSGDPRARHRGLSHHSTTVLDLLLAPVIVALAPGMRVPSVGDLAGAQEGADTGAQASADGVAEAGAGNGAASVIDARRASRLARHDWRSQPIDLPGYAASGLPSETMGRPLAADPLFFVAALAGGGALAELVGAGEQLRLDAAAAPA